MNSLNYRNPRDQSILPIPDKAQDPEKGKYKNKLALPSIPYSSSSEEITDLQNTSTADKVVGKDTSFIIRGATGLGPNSDTVQEPDLSCPQGVTEEQALDCERCQKICTHNV